MAPISKVSHQSQAPGAAQGAHTRVHHRCGMAEQKKQKKINKAKKQKKINKAKKTKENK